jgi:hypothetical protein
MPAREFTDSKGIVWQVWDVTPDRIHPVTRAEEFLNDLQDGWLTFESPTEKRRLGAPYPTDWTTFTIPQLEDLCLQAPVVPVRKKQTPSGEFAALATQQLDHEARAEGERTFFSPRGREWTVREHECLDREGNAVVVLRFTSDDVVVEVSDWPADWRASSVEEFALLMLDANPPRRLQPGEGPRRRREDHEEIQASPQ